MKLLIMLSSPLHCYLISLQPKHLPQHLILKHPQPMYVRMCVCVCVCVYTHTHLLEGIKSEGWMDLYHECHTRPCCGSGSIRQCLIAEASAVPSASPHRTCAKVALG